MDLWEKRRTVVSAVVDGLRQSALGECADGKEVFERLLKRAERSEAAARKS
jgi:hypothetical protein